MMNYWWSWHCSGNLDPENDPYSDDYEYPFSTFTTKEFILTMLLTITFLVVYGVSLYYITYYFVRLRNEWLFFAYIPAFTLMTVVYTKIYSFLMRKI